MFFVLIRSVLSEKRVNVNKSAITSSANLSRNKSFSVLISGYDCRSVLKHHDNFFDVHTGRKRVVGSIYTKQFMWYACRKPLACDKKVVSCKTTQN